MSERVQKDAKDHIAAARQREQSARERAEASDARGNQRMARIHRTAAELQADAAADAEFLLELDRQIEGDQHPEQ